MASIKRKTRKKLSKQLTKLVKRHGADRALAFVTGIVSSLAAAPSKKSGRKQKSARVPAVARKRAPARTSR